MSPTDRGALLDRLLAGRPRFVGFVRRRVGSGADAEEIVQQALVKASEKLHTLADAERLEAWFFRILRRTLVDHRARRALEMSRLEGLAAELEDATPDEVATCGCSLVVLTSLRRDYVDILQRVDLDEQPLAEAARALGITANNATVRLHRARKALREKLLSVCGTDSVRACTECGCDVRGPLAVTA